MTEASHVTSGAQEPEAPAVVATPDSDHLVEDLRQTAAKLTSEREQLENEKAALVIREQAVRTAEAKRDQGFADERTALDRELAERRAQAVGALEREIAVLRSERLAEVDRAESAERDRIRAAVAAERSDWHQQRAQEEANLQQQRSEFAAEKGATAALQAQLEARKRELDDAHADIENLSARSKQQAERRMDNIDNEVNVRIAQSQKSFEEQLRSSNDANAQLRASLQSQSALIAQFEDLRQQLGGRDPGQVLLDLNTLRTQIASQAEELATRPTEEVQRRVEALEGEKLAKDNTITTLERTLQQYQASVAEVNTLKRSNWELEQRNATLDSLKEGFEKEAFRLQAEVDRLQSAYERPAERDKRIGEIEMPAVPAASVTRPEKRGLREIDWLDGVAEASDRYGLHFHPRILRAFHTALKTAEWSPLTVLAGVSGTGKSELPRLYSHFGGLFFQPLSVQPNWDSQESMLGFFNSIDNRFDAQPVLRFLAQTQKKWTVGEDGDYPGLRDAVHLVLLDEMNLAHPELYFAEFLSKLELRRGTKGADTPGLPVKIGSGMEPYKLSLGRNVLWAGTMNQDETTKSLSDKVLDRAIVINFPRPTDLKRRQRLEPLDETNRGETLHRSDWESWWVKASTFTDEQVRPYKGFIEEMNGYLAVAGRAIGHRVWQGIEYYMANYPDVLAAGSDERRRATAMHIAFEDQLVQKVMPKLRGIDTRGETRSQCLDKIRGQLTAGVGKQPFNLDGDFEQAMKLGYGQFIWQSANYLKDENAGEPA